METDSTCNTTAEVSGDLVSDRVPDNVRLDNVIIIPLR